MMFLLAMSVAIQLVLLSTSSATTFSPHLQQQQLLQQTPQPPRKLPAGNLIVAYAPGTCNVTRVVNAVRRGVNVVIWFSINLGFNASNGGAPQVQGGPSPSCIASTAAALQRLGLETTHMISIGGWDAPHPNTTFDGVQWWNEWRRWNENVVARPELGFYGFDGIDWDLEGNDAMSSSWNHFSVKCMTLVGTFSQAAKRAGYLVSLVPPESYLDVTTSAFDRRLDHAYTEWHQDFKYHGHNVYAYWLARYGRTAVAISSAPTAAAAAATAAATATAAAAAAAAAGDDDQVVPTFDFVSLQFYESWAHAGYYIDQTGVPASEYLAWAAGAMQRGWMVDFSSDPSLKFASCPVAVPARQLVIGLSRGSSQAPGQAGKSLFVWPRDVRAAFERMPVEERPRGVMYWNINNDLETVNGTNATCDFASEFNAFLHVRSLS